jgi:hypothetical protein
LKHRSASQRIVEIPSGFDGNFLLEIGVKETAPRVTQGDAHRVTVPRNRKRVTFTLLTNSQPTFRNSSQGAVSGYSQSLPTTEAGIPVGGKIEFFVGTRKAFEAEQARKKHSGGISILAESIAGGI